MNRLLLAAVVVASVLLTAGMASARPAPPDSGVPTVRMVVGIESGSEKDVRASVKAAGGSVVERSYKGRFLVVEVPSVDARRFESAVEGDPGVGYADPQQRVRALYVPNDPSFGDQWHLPTIAAPLAWDTTRGSAAITIAVVDTGVDLGHPDLEDNIDTANDRDFVNNDAIAQDDHGHGTHVAGIAAAVTGNGTGVAGVAGGSKILPVKVLDEYGYGTDSNLAQGIEWAVDRGAEVINISVGGTGTPEPVLVNAINYALASDVVVVAAAGNEGKNEPFYPASVPGVIGVGALSTTGAAASFSNRGDHVDLTAPGDDILSTWPGGGYGWLEGTSMASPVVAGVAALVRSQNPARTGAEVGNILLASATDTGTVGYDQTYGYGIVNAAAAVMLAGSPDDEIPGVPLSGSPISSRVSATSDPHDVFAVGSRAGKRLTVRLDGADAAVNLRLLSADSLSVGAATVLTETISGPSPKTITFDVSQDATYYVDVTTASGSSDYTLSWTHGYPTEVALGGGTSTSWGGPIVLTGIVTRPGSIPVSGSQVRIDRRPTGGVWSTVANRVTGATGRFSVTVYPTSKTEYRAVVPLQNGNYLGSSSGSHFAQRRAYLTTPSAPMTIRRWQYFTATGYLKPRHTAGGRDVKIKSYRYEKGSWNYYKTFSASNSNYSSYTRYTARVALPKTGRWRLIAFIGGDDTHRPTRSGVRYLTVK